MRHEKPVGSKVCSTRSRISEYLCVFVASIEQRSSDRYGRRHLHLNTLGRQPHCIVYNIFAARMTPCSPGGFEIARDVVFLCNTRQHCSKHTGPRSRSSSTCFEFDLEGFRSALFSFSPRRLGPIITGNGKVKTLGLWPERTIPFKHVLFARLAISGRNVVCGSAS